MCKGIKTPIAQLFTNDIYGIHAFITWKGYVLDPSIIQLEEYYGGDQNSLYTIGEFAPGTTYFGWEEVKTTPYQYAKRMAKKQNMTIEEWVDYHKGKKSLFVDFLKKRNILEL